MTAVAILFPVWRQEPLDDAGGRCKRHEPFKAHRTAECTARAVAAFPHTKHFRSWNRNSDRVDYCKSRNIIIIVAECIIVILFAE